MSSRIFGRKLEEVPAALAAAASKAFPTGLQKSDVTGAETTEQTTGRGRAESTLLLTLGWLSAGMGAVAVGLFVGRELRQRYKFNRRTPYDFYAHSGDEVQDMEFGLGI